MSELQQHKARAEEPLTSLNSKTGDLPKAAVVKRSRVYTVLRILGALLIAHAVISYLIKGRPFWAFERRWFTKSAVSSRFINGAVLLDDVQLRAYDGSDPSKPIYVALNGTIYDVTAGARVYGPGGNYHTLAGKDAARAFITGCFEDDNPDIRGAEWTYVPSDVVSPNEPATGAQKIYREQELRKARKQVQMTLEGWKQVFSGKTGKDYFEVGSVRRPANWQNSIPIKELCKEAQKKRPGAKQRPHAADDAHRRHGRKIT